MFTSVPYFLRFLHTQVMKANIVLALVSFLFGCLIMGTSLVQASEVFSVDKISSTSQDISINQPVLPGHLFYPATVLTQKMDVFISSSEKKPFVQLKIARYRLRDSVELIEMEKTGLATQTLWKGQQYLVLLIDSQQKLSMSDELRRETTAVLADYQEVLQTYKDNFSDNQKAVLDQLLAENEVIVGRIRN